MIWREYPECTLPYSAPNHTLLSRKHVFLMHFNNTVELIFFLVKVHEFSECGY